MVSEGSVEDTLAYSAMSLNLISKQHNRPTTCSCVSSTHYTQTTPTLWQMVLGSLQQKNYNNVPIAIDKVYLPVLHLDLGIFPWLYEAMLRDAESIDLMLARSYLDVDSTAFSAVLEKQRTLDEELGKEEQLAKRETEAQHLLHWQLFQMRHAEPGTAAYTQLIAQKATLQKNWSECTQEKQKIQETTTALKAELAVAKVQNGPCQTFFEPVLKANRIERYHSGAFIGNHVDEAAHPIVVSQIVATPVAVVRELLMPGGSPTVLTQQQHNTVEAVLSLDSRYAILFTQYASCRSMFASCNKVQRSNLENLQAKIAVFMQGVRTEVIARQNKTITPKLHLLEAHTVPCMRTFGVGLGLLEEQGCEGVHHRFNQLRASLENVPSDLDRLRLLLSSYLPSTIPSFTQLIRTAKKRKRPVD